MHSSYCDVNNLGTCVCSTSLFENTWSIDAQNTLNEEKLFAMIHFVFYHYVLQVVYFKTNRVKSNLTFMNSTLESRGWSRLNRRRKFSSIGRIWASWNDSHGLILNLSQTSPGFYVYAVQVFWKHCGKRRNCSWRAISPFPTVFSTYQILENFLLFSSNLRLLSANSFSLEESKICRLLFLWNWISCSLSGFVVSLC